MPKQCIFDGCTFNQFGGKYCSRHQWCRKDKKRKPTIRTRIKKVSTKHKKVIATRKITTNQDHVMYAEIWDERPHVCFETGESLGSEPLTLYFHHVLEKGIRRFKKYRHCKWNIVLISWQTHDQVGIDIDRCPKIKEYRDYILKTYVE